VSRAAAEPDRVALGFSAHTGWAVAVAVALDGGTPVVLERRRVELVDASVPWQVYHTASARGLDEAAALVRQAEAVARELATAGVGSLVRELGAAGHAVVGAAVPAGGSRIPRNLARVLASHALLHAAEGELFRQALLAAADQHDLDVHVLPARDLVPVAERVLARDEATLREILATLGGALGPPWRKDEKDATLAGWVALAQHRTRRRR
jgi:hypothetical protein